MTAADICISNALPYSNANFHSYGGLCVAHPMKLPLVTPCIHILVLDCDFQHRKQQDLVATARTLVAGKFFDGQQPQGCHLLAAPPAHQIQLFDGSQLHQPGKRFTVQHFPGALQKQLRDIGGWNAGEVDTYGPEDQFPAMGFLLSYGLR